MGSILIVDDQRCVRELVSEELSHEGYQVHGVGDEKSVKEYLLFSQPDLVLLDLFLDGPEGIGLLEYIKRHYPHLPVIIFTAYDTFMDDSRLSRADGYVIKSVDLDELKDKIADLFWQKTIPPGTVEEESHSPEVGLAHVLS